MYIFRRTSTVHQAHIQPAMEFAVAIAAKVTQITGRDISVYSTLFGAPVGTLHWTTRVDSMADLGDLTAKIGGRSRIRGNDHKGLLAVRRSP